MDLMAIRRSLLSIQTSHEPVIGDIFANAQKTANKTINSSGAEISESNMVVTDFIEIVPETQYTMTLTAGTTGARTRRLMCYDSSNSFISQLASFNWMNKDQVGTNTATMPASAKYARICAYKDDVVTVIGLIP